MAHAQRLQRVIDELAVIAADVSPDIVRRGNYLLERRPDGVIEPVLGRLTGVNPDANGDAIVYLLNHAADIRQLLIDCLNSELHVASALL